MVKLYMSSKPLNIEQTCGTLRQILILEPEKELVFHYFEDGVKITKKIKCLSEYEVKE